MKHIFPRFQLVLCALILCVASLWAVPAYRGWQQRTLADGTTITVRQIGDEFYHYWETQDGQIALEQEDGTFVISDEQAPTGEQIAARRKASKMYQSKPRKTIGERNFAPKGLVILVQFQNVSFNSGNDNTAFTNMLNQEGYSYSGASGSAVDYFRAQSNGQYVPSFDVFGPVTLPQNRIYYGEQGTINGSEENDMYIADFVIDAVKAADEAGCDFSQYDSDNDGYVDIVYFFYAGKGQAAGGTSETIWPHNWELNSALYYKQTHGTSGYSYNNLPRLDGKKINNYVCSAELRSNGTRSGIGTLCHEFSHVLGLPDYYDTDYGTNSDNGVTPGEWSLMDQGSYNNNELTPPNYSIYDKYFMGWATPKFLAKDATANVTMTTGYDDAYQVTGGASRVAYTNTGTVYYIENRQKTGWDAYLPGAGMLVWQVKYNASAWSSNKPNNTAGNPRCTIYPADGKTTNYGASSDVFPTSSVKSFNPFTGCALTSIAKSSGNITFLYNGGVTCHNVITDATGCKITPSTDCVENSTQLTATITPTDASYDFTSLAVKRGNTTLTSGTHYTLSSDKKSLTINASAITGSASDAITITAVWTKNRYSYAMLGENCTEELEGAVTMNASLSLTITPDAGYTLADASCWDVEMNGETLSYGTGFTYNAGTNTFYIASVTGDVSILAYGGRAITWSANGTVFATNIARNDMITLPASTPDDCTGGKKFVGWCTTSNYEHATTAPTFAKTGDTYSSANYYAVYATATSGVASAWELVTDAASLMSGDVLVIASNTKGKTAGDISSQYMAETSSTFSNDYSTITSLGSGAVELTLGGTTGAWTLSSGGKALGATEVKKLAWGSGTTTWSISISGGNATIQNGTSSYGRFLHNVSSTRFATYGSGTATSATMLLPQLYRKSASVSYSDYSTTCVVCELSSISLNTENAQKSFYVGDTFTHDGVVVTANYSNCASKTVNGFYKLPNMSSAGTKTVEVSYSENGASKYATYDITVVELVKHTITWMACGSQFKTEQYVDGDPLVLPATTPPANSEGKTFYGWIAEEHYSGADAPDKLTAGGAVTADATYYAVYY